MVKGLVIVCVKGLSTWDVQSLVKDLLWFRGSHPLHLLLRCFSLIRSILWLNWTGKLRGFVVEGHSSIGIVTFVVKVLFIDKVRSMITLGRRIKWLRGIHILALCCYSAIYR